ncbi:hypothetical protein K493DRAFT_302438 [Basidiobolus meristosporus CBS 931.73]|uniref:Uncharacterized protein n=1 Tax=Basidiobolus meristosporus CBS 931.73 TaxID=1314790 RepID=A0A1Y1Y739_9FUNG|nr:hypothetical protein K493DRAFT_302438 [Basidiobolus meristosporus CBS 931.73]|eukprot:ORX93831.1 hypothetical protein K493DRAFT_302438 [Basidiobolus meristosporus CBS 931.73]
MSNIRVSSREALLLSDIMANMDALSLSPPSRKRMPNTQFAENIMVEQVVREIMSASLSQAFTTSTSNLKEHSAAFDPFDNIPLATFSYHEIPIVDEDFLPHYAPELPCSPPPSYPSGEYPFQKPKSIAPQSAARVLAEAREAMKGKFHPTQVLFTHYVHELLMNRQGLPFSPTKRPSIKDPHGICWPLKGERRNRKYHFENYLPPRLSGAREIRSNRAHMRLMALEESMIKAGKICSPLRPHFSLPKRVESFCTNIPSGLRHACSLEDLVWEAYLDV